MKKYEDMRILISGYGSIGKRHAEVLRSIGVGEIAVSDILEKIRDKHADATELTQREIDVLRLVAKGYTNKEIAEHLFISTNTVLSHRKNISAKLGIRSVSGLSVYAMMNGYIGENPHEIK